MCVGGRCLIGHSVYGACTRIHTRSIHTHTCSTARSRQAMARLSSSFSAWVIPVNHKSCGVKLVAGKPIDDTYMIYIHACTRTKHPPGLGVLGALLHLRLERQGRPPQLPALEKGHPVKWRKWMDDFCCCCCCGW